MYLGKPIPPSKMMFVTPGAPAWAVAQREGLERLTDIMCRSFQDVLQLAKQHKVNMRTAAYMLSISRVATVHRLRGIYA